MRRFRWTTWWVVSMLAVVPVYGDEEVDMLIAYLLDELDSRQTPCSESQLAEYADKRLVCGEYDASFSALKSDWEQLMRHTRLPIPISTEEAWTFRDGAYRIAYSHGDDREFLVMYDPKKEKLQFAYAEKDLDAQPDNTRVTNPGPLDLGASEAPRVAGFGGVSVPTVIEGFRVEPLRSLHARTERVAGTVTLEIVVQKDGTVRNVVVLNATPDGYDFDVSALEAVRRWKFEPALFEGQPIDVVLDLTVEIKQDPPDPGED